MYSFRCRKCGHLQSDKTAGEHLVPFACSVCGAGVIFNPRGLKMYEPEVWEVLADAAPERLAELGLTASDITRHIPFRTEHRRLPDVQRPYPHTGAAVDPRTCQACRRGGKDHADGSVEVLTLPEYERVEVPLAGESASVNPSPKDVTVAVGENTSVSGKVN